MTVQRIAKRFSLMPLLVLAQVVSAPAQQPKSQAESWGVQNEEPAVLSGRIVDILCELTKDCPAECGAGKRQLGLLTPGGRLVLIAKNSQPLFNGAVADLLPYCQTLVDVDGLMTGNEQHRMFQLQLIRKQGARDWSKAELWTQVWRKQNPAFADKAEEWFHHDPRVARQIDATGYLGLGPAADRDFARTR
jgi:hypothetical protein